MGQSRKEAADVQLVKEWDQLYYVRQKVIQSIAKNMDLFGVTPSVGRLYGTLYFHDDPMTLDHMCEHLGMSKTSMSTGVRSLLESHMVHQTWKKGERRDLYIAESDWYTTFVELFTTKWKRAVDTNSREIKAANQELNELLQQTEDTKLKVVIEHDLQKLEHANEYYDWLMRLVECFESGEIFKHVPKRPNN